ncbi:MAG: hypothetical protein HY904_04475 [Deltaproteobacteria bacterium]|nr:hypothetical protein [Deltaproteobacteria bacterium]
MWLALLPAAWLLLQAAVPPAVQELMDDAEYQKARRQVDRLLRNSRLSADDRVALYAAHAFCDVSLGDDATAQQSFQKLLTLKPGYRADPNTTSPTVLEVFTLVRARMAEQGALDQAYGPEFQPLPDVSLGEAVDVRVAFRAPAAAELDRAFIRYRRVGEASFESAELPRAEGGGAVFAGAVPATFLQADDDFAVEYHLEAVNAAGERLTGVGTADLPLQFRVDSPKTLAVAAEPPRRGGADTGKKVAGLVVPWVVGAVAVLAVAWVAGSILVLTAIQPGASHLFVRLGKPQQGK